MECKNSVESLIRSVRLAGMVDIKYVKMSSKGYGRTKKSKDERIKVCGHFAREMPESTDAKVI